MRKKWKVKKIEDQNYLEKIKSVNELIEKRDVPKLIELLKSESWVVRERASMGIVPIGREYKNELIKILEQGFWYEKASVLFIFGEWRDKQTIKNILPYLYNENSTLTKESAIAITKILLAHNTVPEEIKKEDVDIIFRILKDNGLYKEIEQLKNFFKNLA